MKIKRLTIDIPADWHKELKLIAIKYNVTMREILNTLILEKLHKERDLDKE